MSRDKSTYKEIFNRALTLVQDIGVDAALPTETELARRWQTSRTTVRAVLTELDQLKMISWLGRQKTVLRLPLADEYFSIDETTSISDRVETKFMDFILGGDLKPGAILREAELVRAFDSSTSVVRELLIRFSRFGLIEKEPNRHWVLRGFTREFAIELFDVREMFERRAFEAFLAKGVGSPGHSKLLALTDEHTRIAQTIDTTYLAFPRLDEAFHKVWIDAQGNRFVMDFFALVSVIFHYHYRWNKQDERERNLVAIHQHLAVIEAVRDNDPARALAALEVHLADARATLLASVPWEVSV